MIIRHTFSTVLLGSVLFCLLASGCVTTSGQHKIFNISVSPGGTISVKGRKTTLTALPKRLRSLGASPASRISVALARNTPQMLLKEITRTLNRAGFTKIHFHKPRQAKAFVRDTQRTNRRAF